MSSARNDEGSPGSSGHWWLGALLGHIRQARGGQLTTYRDRYLIAALLSVLPLNLGWLLHLFGSDKQRAGEHQYGATYHIFLRPYRYKPLRLLEIGVLSGASLLAWRAFFPFGRFFGADIDKKTHFDGGRIATRIADQSSAADLAALCSRDGPFDVVLDDGSHQNAHQIFTFYELFPRLAENGLYIIEDIQTSFWPGFFGGAHFSDPAFASTCVGEFLELSKYLNHNEFHTADGLDPRRLAFAKSIKRIVFEHNIVIVQKGQNDDGSNFESRAKANVNWREEV